MRSSAEEDDAILTELVALARRPALGLLQFLSLASARQYRPLYRLFRRHVAPSATVLDWGAGNGHFSYFLTRAGYRATGFSFEGREFVSWLGDPTYRVVAGSPAEATMLPFERGAFDAVASVGVLEHVRETGGNEIGSLREIARILRPGGVFVCYHFPNRTSAIDFFSRAFPGKHHHDYRYDARGIAALVRAADLELLEVRRYGLLPRNSCQVILGPWGGSRHAANLWDALDRVLGWLLSPLCQNYLFVARKPTAARGAHDRRSRE